MGDRKRPVVRKKYYCVKVVLFVDVEAKGPLQARERVERTFDKLREVERAEGAFACEAKVYEVDLSNGPPVVKPSRGKHTPEQRLAVWRAVAEKHLKPYMGKKNQKKVRNQIQSPPSESSGAGT